MRSLKLITLDSTGTLIRVKGSVGKIYSQAASEFGIEAEADLIDEGFILAFKNMSEHWPNFGYPNMPSKEWWRHTVFQTFDRAGHDGIHLNEVFEKLYVDFSQAKGWEYFPEIRDVLGELKARDLKLAVISNFDERLTGIFESMGLADSFDFILTSREAGCEKPDAQIFQRALGLAGVEAETALHIGDHERKDFFGAKDAGMHSLLIRRDSELQEGETDIVSDLKGALHRIDEML